MQSRSITGDQMPLITGAHSIVYSREPEADRALLRDTFGLPNVDVGEGWLIFALPPAEVAVHPARENDVHELYLMTEDVRAFVADMAKRGVACAPPRDLGWGVLTEVRLPGGGKLGVYEPRHARPQWTRSSTRRGRPATTTRAKPSRTRLGADGARRGTARSRRRATPAMKEKRPTRTRR
jgi:hypothetical protein